MTTRGQWWIYCILPYCIHYYCSKFPDQGASLLAPIPIPQFQEWIDLDLWQAAFRPDIPGDQHVPPRLGGLLKAFEAQRLEGTVLNLGIFTRWDFEGAKNGGFKLSQPTDPDFAKTTLESLAINCTV
jgi:hypothetical protein